MKKIILIPSLFACAFALAQQQPLYTQYLQNSFVLNPAAAGLQGYTEIRSIIRNQWAGFDNGNPKTNTISLNSGWDQKKIGLGGYVFTDKLGPVSKTGLNGTYAYHFKVGKESLLSFGISGMFYLYRLDVNQLNFGPNDHSDKVLMSQGNFKAYNPNIGFGAFYKTKNFFAGFSIPQMLEIKISPSQDFYVMQERRHYYFNTGITLKMSDNIDIDPSLLIKHVGGAPTQVDALVRVDYKRTFYVGAAYRSGAAIALMFGYTYKDALIFGYAYDVTTSDIGAYGRGTHEIMLGYNLHRKPKEEPKTKTDAPPPPPQEIK
ncbi:MAG TPA: type IX secretion system membrane protein PorP/SprF [Bacteroidia bacterium]